MPRWPIRLKLIVGLSLVVAMMMTLLAGAVIGLRAFHRSNLTLTDQLRELGASKDLLQAVMQLDLDDRELEHFLTENGSLPSYSEVGAQDLPTPGSLRWSGLLLVGLAHGEAQRAATPPIDDRVERTSGPYVTILDSDARRRELLDRLLNRLQTARQALLRYYSELERNSLRGNRSDGRDEFTLAFLIDDDLTGVLRQLQPDLTIDHLIDRTSVYLTRHPEADMLNAGPWEPFALTRARLDRLTSSAIALPDKLHSDFFLVLEASKRHYQSSRVMIWTVALAVLAMLCGLTKLVHRWLFTPIRLLHRGVRHVARGSFDYQIELQTGDEMQALAEAFNDMTTRLGASYAELEQQVSERSRQLVRSERLAGVGFLAAGVAHEINNPLASIAFCAEALEGRLEPVLRTTDPEGTGDSRVVRDYLRMIQEEAFRCKRITEKLLDFSRCGEIQSQRTNLVELIEGVVDMMRHMGKYRNKTILFQPREAVIACVDPQEIKQVILNLVVNALDSMDAGGTLRIDARVSGGRAELTFRDEGCGMSPEVLENIFEPFFTRRKAGKGTGLGLSISHRIINQHHGEITATSPGEGCGSTFFVRLPTQIQNSRRDRGVTEPSRGRHPLCKSSMATGDDDSQLSPDLPIQG
ncbi:HAMP domain-containing sensor histidine kinase [Tautonia rosea]|uniref:HAMP domain-containing sensor histidine kinase n=1 Tax=Tautonia rosea TaxID=2728037 RepID=UPI001F321966|nr:HAMP domain-containing sensor histidine kinase [Tautonia rosea]